MSFIERHWPVESGERAFEQAVVKVEERVAGAVVDQRLDLPAAVAAEIADGATVEAFDGHAFARCGVADERVVRIIQVGAAVIVIFNKRDGRHLEHRQAFPLGRLDHVSAIVDAVSQRGQAACLVLILRIEEMDDVLRGQPLI